ncbi:unnamed protein product [Adineta ricciae]|uniref:Uncharacterized protein n=1 Tax=Adineta ricciae TaxID=249248 RepID=A0A816HUS0_ADIRI|nr:unnamed protein product [Adineta ricciae]
MVNDTSNDTSYAGACSDISAEGYLLFGPKNRHSRIPILRLFLGKYQIYPSLLECETDDNSLYYHVTTILNYLREQYHHDLNKDCVSRTYHRKLKTNYTDCRLIDLGNGIMIRIYDSILDNDVKKPK